MEIEMSHQNTNGEMYYKVMFNASGTSKNIRLDERNSFKGTALNLTSSTLYKFVVYSVGQREVKSSGNCTILNYTSKKYVEIEYRIYISFEEIQFKIDKARINLSISMFIFYMFVYPCQVHHCRVYSWMDLY